MQLAPVLPPYVRPAHAEMIVVRTEHQVLRAALRVPARHREDERLVRILAFRLKVDGFETTKDFVSRKLIEAERCTFRGLLYDFLKDDEESRACQET